MIVRVLLVYGSHFNAFVLTELGYVLISKVNEEEKKCSFGNALLEKSKSSTRNKNGLVEGLYLFCLFTLSRVIFN